MRERFYYSDFRMGDLCTPKYRHLWYLLFWPVFAVSFFGIRLIPTDYHEIHCAIDDLIPFSKGFIFTYVSWFFFLAWTVLYTGVHDIPSFVRFHRYMILTGGIAFLFFVFYPSAEYMRPETVTGNDPASLLIRLIYAADTPTNILPSGHVLFAFGVALTVLSSSRPKLRKGWFRAAVLLQALIISASTMLIKQHSILDVLAAVPFILLGWALFFRRKKT